MLRNCSKPLFLLLAAALIPCAFAADQYTLEIVTQHPHDREAFTQGLVYADGELFESIGRRGKSALRRVDLASGKVLAQTRVEDRYFAEGLALVDNRLIQLTWKAGTGFIYDRKSLKQLGSFSYPGEGWGLTYDGVRLILSDGTPVLRFLDPDTFAQTGSLTVTHLGKPISQLNELEMVNGEVWANLWRYDLIARIDPENGHVIGLINASELRKNVTGLNKIDVLNGIAYDPSQKKLLLTGKLWPRIFEVKVHPATP